MFSEDIEEEVVQVESGDHEEEEATGHFPQQQVSLSSREYSSVISEGETSGGRSGVSSVVQEAGGHLQYSSAVVEEEVSGLGMRITAASTVSTSSEQPHFSSGVEEEEEVSGFDRSSIATAVSGLSATHGHSGSVGASDTIVESIGRSRSTVEYSSEVFEEEVPKDEEEDVSESTACPLDEEFE
jgi:hypothetical protein